MKLIPLALCLALAAGCQRESDGAKGPNPAVRHSAPVVVQHGPTVDELTAGMVEAATQGKSQAPVGLKFDLLRRPVQGEPLEISIALLPREPAGSATVEVISPEGLPVAPEERKFEFDSLEAAQVYRRTIRLTPTGEGVFLLTLTVNLKRDQLADTRVFSVPVIVAANALANGAGNSAQAPASPGPASSGNPPPTPPGSPTT
jgi:hypothetical protein